MQDDITKNDTPTSGKVNLYFDEGLTLHIKNQIYTFTTTYKYADINLVATNEKACVEALYHDSSKIIAISRPLSENELKQFHAKNVYPQTSRVAGDAIAFIVNHQFADSTISLEELTELLKGNDSAFVAHQRTSIVFDNPNSGSTRHLKDSLLRTENFGKNCTASNHTPQLIQTIATNSLAIGVCDYAWLSDKDDNTTKNILKKVKILAVSKSKKDISYLPDQSNIATGDYPLCRSICIIRRSAEFSLGKGIETFIAGDKGQLMFLKQGLPPNRQEERLIEVDMTPFKITE
jgi:phosphate transport system substrate-binding protein